MSDEIMAEVREIKNAIGARYGYDLRAIFADIQRGEAEMRAAGVRVLAPPDNAATLPSSALQRARARLARG